jgi:uncharacterized membrane protein YfcA
MLESFPISVLVGTALGFLSGLGVGGGSLLILWLTAILETPPQQARIINLLFFLPAAFISCVLRIQKGSLTLKPLIPAILGGCICAVIFSKLSTGMDVTLLKKLFGVLLIITGVRELLQAK